MIRPLPIYPKKKYYATQRWAFHIIIRKHHPELLSEWKDLFAEFWMEFKPGTGMSIYKFLYADVRSRKLKRGIMNGG